MKPNKVGISLSNAYAYVLFGVPTPQSPKARPRPTHLREPADGARPASEGPAPGLFVV